MRKVAQYSLMTMVMESLEVEVITQLRNFSYRVLLP